MLSFFKATMLLLLFVVTATSAGSITPYATTLASLTTAGSIVQEAFYDSQGRIVYFDWDSKTVRRQDLDGTTTILATTDSCYYLTEGPSQELYLSLVSAHKIQKLDVSLTLTDFAGSGTAGHTDATGTSATFTAPNGIVYFALHTALYLAEDGAIRKIVVSTQVVSTVVSSTTYLSSGRHLAITRNGTYIYAGFRHVTQIEVATGAIKQLVDATGGDTVGDIATASIGYVWAYALSLNETRLMIGDSQKFKIRRLNLCTGYIDDVYSYFLSLRGFRQYCLPTTGDCGFTYSGYSTKSVRFYAFEDNQTLTNYLCAAPVGPSATHQVTPSFSTTSTPTVTDTPSPSLSISISVTSSPTASPSTSNSFSPSRTPTRTSSAAWTTTNSLSVTTHSVSRSVSGPTASQSGSFTNTKPLVEDAGSWGASVAVIVVVSVAAVGGAVAVGIVALKTKAASIAASVAASVNAPATV